MIEQGARVLALAIAGGATATLLWLGAAARAEAQLYRWTDESGQVHVTDDLNQVPPAQRERLRQQSAPPPSPEIIPRQGGDRRLPPRAECQGRLEAWFRSGQAPARFSRSDLDRAIGADCAAVLDQAVTDDLKLLKTANEECFARLQASVDFDNTLYTYRRPDLRQLIWRDISRAAGPECADLIMRLLAPFIGGP